MNVDLLSALDDRTAEEPARASTASENEFPKVLQASMASDESVDARSQETPSQPSAEPDEPTSREDQPREQPPADDPLPLAIAPAAGQSAETAPDELISSGTEPEQDDVEARASALAASLGGSLGNVGAASDRAGTTVGASAVVSVEGPPSASGGAVPGPAGSDLPVERPFESESGGAFPRPLADGQAELAREAALTARRSQEPGAPREPASQAPSQTQTIGQETMATVAQDPAVTRVADPPLRSESAVASDRAGNEASISEAREAASAANAATAGTAEASSDQGRDPSDDPRQTPLEREEAGQAARNADAAEFGRALDGAQSGGVDANLRQAVATREDARNAPDAVAVSGGAVVANPIAGSVSEMTPAAPAGSSPAAPSEAISVQTEWLATRGGGTARLVLHPQELGEVAIRVTLRGASVEVVMVAQEAAAQSIAEDQADRLFQALASRDLRMDQFEVRRGEPGDLSQTGGDRFAESDDGQERSGDGQRSADEQQTSASDRGSRRGLAGRAAGGVEVPPRIVSVAETAKGVDLRI